MIILIVLLKFLAWSVLVGLIVLVIRLLLRVGQDDERIECEQNQVDPVTIILPLVALDDL